MKDVKRYKALVLELTHLSAEINWKTADEYYMALSLKDKDYILKPFEKLSKKICDLGEELNSLADNGKYILPSELVEVYRDSSFVSDYDDATEDMQDAIEECKQNYTAYLKFLDSVE